MDTVFIIRRPIEIGENPVFCSHRLLLRINLAEEVVRFDWPQLLSYFFFKIRDMFILRNLNHENYVLISCITVAEVKTNNIIICAGRHLIFLKTKSIVRNCRSHTYITSDIYTPYILCGKLAELLHTPTCFISCWKKYKEIRIVISIFV